MGGVGGTQPKGHGMEGGMTALHGMTGDGVDAMPAWTTAGSMQHGTPMHSANCLAIQPRQSIWPMPGGQGNGQGGGQGQIMYTHFLAGCPSALPFTALHLPHVPDFSQQHLPDLQPSHGWEPEQEHFLPQFALESQQHLSGLQPSLQGLEPSHVHFLSSLQPVSQLPDLPQAG